MFGFGRFAPYLYFCFLLVFILGNILSGGYLLNCTPPGLTARFRSGMHGGRLFFTFFRIDFRKSFFLILPPFLVVCFNDFSCFCRYLFEAVFLMNFYSFLDRSLNCVNPKIIEISLVLIHYFALGTFRRRSIFGPISYEFRDNFRIDFSLIFMIFSASNLASFFH